MTFRSSILGAAVGATACTLLIAGCSGGSYYMVRQPGAATPYYTTGIERAGNYAVQFKDGRSGSDVVLQNSEVTKISQEDYTRGITTPVPAPTVGAVAPVPSAATVTVPVVTAVPAAGAPVPSALAPVPGAAADPAAAGASAPAPQGKPQ
jgi:hypothetical protein